MAGINKVIIVGNLGQDPDVRTTPTNETVTTITVATSEKWQDKQTGKIAIQQRLLGMCCKCLIAVKAVIIKIRRPPATLMLMLKTAQSQRGHSKVRMI